MESAAERGRLKSSPNVTPLVAALRAALAEKTNAQIQLKADGRLSFRHIQSLFDLCREAGAEVVSAVTASDQSQPTQGGLS